jgi:DNA-binding NarL/FixJ family response regulator
MTKIKLSPEARAAKNAYQKAWAKRNPDKVRRSIENYWERKAAEMNNPRSKARELYANGYTQREIAEKLEVSVGTVNAYLKKN